MIGSVRSSRGGFILHGVWYLGFCLVFGAATRRGRDQCGQATKGMWGMPWRQEAKKGVEDCDKPGGLVKREMIPGFPNGPSLNP